MCRPTNRRSNLTEPENWFKIVHITPELRNVRPETTDREQTVEITLGPKGTFENGNIDTQMRTASLTVFSLDRRPTITIAGKLGLMSKRPTPLGLDDSIGMEVLAQPVSPIADL